MTASSLPDGSVKWIPVHKLAWDVPFFGHLDLGLNFASYNGLTSVLLNFVVAALLSVVIRPRGKDETRPEDYLDRDVTMTRISAGH